MSPYLLYLNWIDSQKNMLSDRVKKWAEINTFTANVRGLSQLLTVLESDFKGLGGEASRIKLPPHKILGERGTIVEEQLGDALVLRKRPEAPIQIFLGGHYDTVFDPSIPFQSVVEIEKNIWNGPGVADMKGGLAILLTAVEALERTPFKNNIGWEILITPDEEIGSPGSTPLYEAAAKRHHIGLIFEPSFSDGFFVSERKGSDNYTVIVRGISAHAGRDFHKGKSALFALASFIHQLSLLKGDFTLNVANVEAKGPVNIVPDLATCRINIRSNKPETLKELFQKLEEMALKLTEEGITFAIMRDSHRDPKPFDQKTKGLFQAYHQCASELKIPFETRLSGGICDGNILAGAGLPTIDSLGAVGGGLHTYDEYLLLSSLVERAKLTALFLFKVANRELEVPHA